MKTKNFITPPFDCDILDLHAVLITNPISGESCTLQPEAIAVYDCIRGAEVLGDFKTMRIGLDWFIENFIDEYMILLD